MASHCPRRHSARLRNWRYGHFVHPPLSGQASLNLTIQAHDNDSRRPSSAILYTASYNRASFLASYSGSYWRISRLRYSAPIERFYYADGLARLANRKSAQHSVRVSSWKNKLMITIPTDFVTNFLAYATTQFSNFSGITETLIGILLALLLVGGLVQLIRHH